MRKESGTNERCGSEILLTNGRALTSLISKDVVEGPAGFLANSSDRVSIEPTR